MATAGATSNNGAGDFFEKHWLTLVCIAVIAIVLIALYVKVIKPLFGSLEDFGKAVFSDVGTAATAVVTTVTGNNSTVGQWFQNTFGRTTGDNLSIIAGTPGIASATQYGTGSDVTITLSPGIQVTNFANSSGNIYVATLTNGDTIYVDMLAQPTLYSSLNSYWNAYQTSLQIQYTPEQQAIINSSNQYLGFQ